MKQPLLLITPEGKEEETIKRLSRVGFDNALGYLKGGIEAWKKAGFETDHLDSITPEEFAVHYTDKPVIDARRKSEFEAEHVEGAVNIPLDYVNEHLTDLPQEATYYLHCAGGYRSVIMASILKSKRLSQHDKCSKRNGRYQKHNNCTLQHLFVQIVNKIIVQYLFLYTFARIKI